MHRAFHFRSWLFLFGAATAFGQTEQRPADPFPLAKRFSHYLYRTYSWQRMAWLGLDTGFDFGISGAPGLNELAQRYGDGFGRRVVKNSTEFAVGALLQEDGRYRGLYKGSYMRRLRHATVRAFQAADSSSHYRPAYSRFAAIAAGELVSPVWSRGSPGTDVLSCVGLSLLGQMENNYLSEFTPELKGFGRSVGKKLRGLASGVPRRRSR